MSTAMAPQVLADPIGVAVDVISTHDPALDRVALGRLVADLAGGRAKRRRLAQACDRPAVLGDGRSPGPRVIAELLTALGKAGAAGISPPVCAECGKQLRALQRRGEHWHCGQCSTRKETCVACGKVRPVHRRDRGGNSRCAKCGPDDDRDPVESIVEMVTRADPTLPADVVILAVDAAVPKPGQRWHVAWALQERPELLTGSGAEAPIPAVLRLIDQLCERGAATITRPACPHCQRTIHLHRSIE